MVQTLRKDLWRGYHAVIKQYKSTRDTFKLATSQLVQCGMGCTVTELYEVSFSKLGERDTLAPAAQQALSILETVATLDLQGWSVTSDSATGRKAQILEAATYSGTRTRTVFPW